LFVSGFKKLSGLSLLDDGFGDVVRRRLVVIELHREGGAALGHRTQRVA
jgi:hypothetical protein